MLKYLKPYKINSEKIRLGRDSDGGYVIPKILAEKCDALVTYGYGGDKNFEDHFIEKYDKPNYIFDHTVNQERWSQGDQYFYPEGLGYSSSKAEQYQKSFIELKEKLKSIQQNVESFEIENNTKFLRKTKKYVHETQDLLNRVIDCVSVKTPKDHYINCSIKGEILLKIDTEGAEYDYFMNEDIEELSSFVNGIILEVHSLDQPRYQSLFSQIMEKINSEFVLVHIHGNNWGGDFVYEGHTIPKVIEFAFVNKKYVDKKEVDTSEYPIKNLDYPNNPNLPECDLSFLKKI